MLNSIKTTQKNRGFTIVELLIVIVVIAILAAISIVAYTGITSRANASRAKSNATSVLKVVEAYAADDVANPSGAYPDLTALGNYSGIARVPSGVTVNAAVLSATQADGKTIQYVSKAGGACVGFWDATKTPSAGVSYVLAGNATTGSTNTASPTCT